MKIKSSGTARATVLLEASPQDLRQIADRMELAAQNVNSNREHVMLEVTDQLTLIYKVDKHIIFKAEKAPIDFLLNRDDLDAETYAPC